MPPADRTAAWEDFSWKLLVKAISAEFKGDWERQSIAKYPHLQREFQKTQERIRKAQRDEKAGRRVSRTGTSRSSFSSVRSNC
jgi:hypothetical protein